MFTHRACIIDNVEGTLVAKKDFALEKHSDAVPIPNIEVLNLMKSFKSKGFVRETFNWQYYYFYLTPEGIDYLREYLALPADIVPATLKEKAQKARPGMDDKEKVAGGDFNPEYSQSRGRDGYR